jgi:DNA topoisomerase IA
MQREIHTFKAPKLKEISFRALTGYNEKKGRIKNVNSKEIKRKKEKAQQNEVLKRTRKKNVSVKQLRCHIHRETHPPPWRHLLNVPAIHGPSRALHATGYASRRAERQ